MEEKKIDYYLKFKDQEEMISLLTSIGYYNEEGNFDIPVEVAIDVIGVMYTDGEFDLEGNMIVAPQRIDGYHVNLRIMTGELPTELIPFLVLPKTPSRVWF